MEKIIRITLRFVSLIIAILSAFFANSCNSRRRVEYFWYDEMIYDNQQVLKRQKQEYEIRKNWKREQLNEYIRFISNILEIDPILINEKTSFKDDLNVDAMKIARIMSDTQRRYLIQISEEDISKLSTVGAAFNYVYSKRRKSCSKITHTDNHHKFLQKDLLYTEFHLWVLLTGDIATIGLTDYGQQDLGDIVYSDFSRTGTIVKRGEEIGVVEAVKAVFEIISPLSGRIIDVNYELVDCPERINSDPYGNGWFVKIELSDKSEIYNLFKKNAYKILVERKERIEDFTGSLISYYHGGYGPAIELLVRSGIHNLHDDAEIKAALEIASRILKFHPLRNWNDEVESIGYKKFFNFIRENKIELNSQSIIGTINEIRKHDQVDHMKK